jgi:5'-nucleotidase
MAKLSRRAFLRATTVGTAALGWTFSGLHLKTAHAVPDFTLRILHSNDHHARVESEINALTIGGTSASPVTRRFGGLARRKTLIDSRRNAGGVPTLTLDAGDVFQGTLYFNLYQGFADLAIYREIGYDAMTLGNHEFNLGPDHLARFVQGATGAVTSVTPSAPGSTAITLGGTNFDVICANISVSSGPLATAGIQPRITRTLGGKTVGIFGLATPETVFLSSPGPTVTFSDPIAAAQAQVTALQGAGVNYIICLSHLGYGPDLDLADRVPGIDVIVGGHTHTPLRPTGDTRPLGQAAASPYPTVVRPTAANPTLIVTAWEWGKWLGEINVGFDASGNVLPGDTTVTLHPVWAEIPGTRTTLLTGEEAAVTPNAAINTRITTEFKPRVDALGSTQVGTIATTLDGDRPNVRTRETNLGTLIGRAMLTRARRSDPTARVAIMNGGGIRASIPAGNVTVGQIIAVLPFSNTLARVDLTPAQLKTALENGVARVNLGRPGDSAGQFPQVAGLRFTYNPSGPVGQRVQQIELERIDASGNFTGTYEAPLDVTATTPLIRVITNNFLLNGGDNYTVFTQGANRLDLAFDLSEVLQEAIVSSPNLAATTAGLINIQTFTYMPTLFNEPATVTP